MTEHRNPVLRSTMQMPEQPYYLSGVWCVLAAPQESIVRILFLKMRKLSPLVEVKHKQSLYLLPMVSSVVNDLISSLARRDTSAVDPSSLLEEFYNMGDIVDWRKEQ